MEGPHSGIVAFRNLLPGKIPVKDGFYSLTNRTRDGIVEYRWQEPTAPPSPKTQPKPKPKRKAKP
jgi:hypothetical protein